MSSSCKYTEDQLNQIFITASENQQNGLLTEAQRGYLELISLFSKAPILHYNLGLIYFEQDEYQKALESFSIASALVPEDADITFNLALSQKKCGDLSGAIKSYEKVLADDPESVDTLYNLAVCHREASEYSIAIDTCLRVLALEPGYTAAINNLAYLYHREGENEKALAYYQKVVEHDPEHQSARHMLASLLGDSSTNSPESYVTDVFDNYSGTYEHSLVTELRYCVPLKIRKVLEQLSLPKTTFECGLDLGCGTGLGGEAFTDVVETFDGIDLSHKMLEIAEGKGIYRTLHHGSLQDYLKACAEAFDFLLAADVFGYIGELKEVFQLLRKYARQDVIFCFSTETISGKDLQLQKTGRFAHSPEYIENLAATTGWSVQKRSITQLRKEKDGWVEGDLWVLNL